MVAVVFLKMGGHSASALEASIDEQLFILLLTNTRAARVGTRPSSLVLKIVLRRIRKRTTHGSVYHPLQSLRNSPCDRTVAVGF
jgi:hypothetical protein